MSRSYTRQQSAMEERLFRFKRERQDEDGDRPEYLPEPLAVPIHYRAQRVVNDRMSQELRRAGLR